MNQDEAASLPDRLPKAVGDAIRAWSQYVEQVESVVHLTHDGFQMTQKTPELYEVLYGDLPDPDGKYALLIQGAKHRASYAKRESQAGFPIVHAHALLGLWGALECLIEDSFLATLESEPSLLAEAPFRKIRLPVSMLLQGSDDDRFRAILSEASRATDADLASGVSKFERLLKMVHADGRVPARVKESIFQAQQIRNVWAHRGGYADARFVERCPHLGYSVGQRIDMQPQSFLHYMHGIHMYGLVIINRYLARYGCGRVESECPGYEGALRELYGEGAKPQDRLKRTSANGRSTP